MQRSYHVDIAGHVASADRKWVDNLLSHFAIPGVERNRRGTMRRVTHIGVYHIVLVRSISQDLGVSLKNAVALAADLMCSGSSAVPLVRTLALHFDRDEFQRDVDARVVEAVEAIVPARRGRPPARHTRPD